MEPEIATTLIHQAIVKLLWSQLCEVYSRINNLQRTYELHQAFSTIHQGTSSLETYYAQFRSICDEFSLCQSITADIKAMQTQREQIFVAHFLHSLDLAYAPVRSHLLASADVVSLSMAFSRLRQASITAPDTSLTFSLTDHSALVASGHSGSPSGGAGQGTARGTSGRSSRGRGRSRGDPLCTHCQGTNHTVDHCWVLHEKPKHMAHSVYNTQYF